MSDELQKVEDRIFTFRELQVMIDRDLAEMYQVKTKVLNQAVKRNENRFPQAFRFQLTDGELKELVTNCDRLEKLKYSASNPYAFTEQGVAMLSAVLRSDTAVKVSIQIMNAFISMRKELQNNLLLRKRIDTVELKQLQADQNFEVIFKALESKNPTPDKGVFFDGQVFDAYTLVASLIRKAEISIILIDNYVDDTVLTLLSKRNEKVKCTICTKNIGKQLKQDVDKHNTQYPPIDLFEFKKAHDRFLILDQTELYHMGASIKDLGKKWFAFSKMDTEAVNIIENLKVLGYE